MPVNGYSTAQPKHTYIYEATVVTNREVLVPVVLSSVAVHHMKPSPKRAVLGESLMRKAFTNGTGYGVVVLQCLCNESHIYGLYI